jgi:hypothetical protein
VAAKLPAELGAAVVAAAREAFIQGLQPTAALSAAVAIAVVATVLLRHVPAGAEAAEQPTPAAEPASLALSEGAFQVIRSGSGCMTCPGESRLEDAHGA